MSRRVTQRVTQHAWWLAGVLALVWQGAAPAQTGGSGTRGGSGAGGGSGASGGSGSSGAIPITGNFSGGTGTSGGNTFGGGMGGTTGGASGTVGPGGTRTGTGVQVPASTNLYTSYFGNPMYQGMITTGQTARKQGGFAQPLYATVTTSGAGTSTARTSSSSTPPGFTTVGIRKNPPYITVLSDDIPLVQRTLNRAELQQAVTQSSRLRSGNGIAVDIRGNTVVLRGEVATDRERRIAEGIIRMTPGVRDVANELRVAGSGGP